MGNIIENIIQVLPSALKEQANLTPFQLMTFLAGEMEKSDVSSDWRNAKPYDKTVKAFPLEKMNFSISDKLGVKTGEYLKSFDPRSKNTQSKVTLDSNTLRVDFGTNLPRLHETGGFIRATPYSNIKTKKKGYLMAQHFWKNYFLSRNNNWKILALSVMKKGGINVKKRPHFNPAIEKFKSNINIWLNDILDKIIKKANELP